ncbi:hypothetical protein D3C73_589970 [compost metagenome]
MAAQAQGLNRRQAVVDHIGVAAIPVEGEPAIVASQLAAESAGGAGACPHSTDRLALVGVARFGIRVVAEHVAGGVAAEGGVVGPPRLDGGASVGHRQRGVIAPLDGDGQGLGADEATEVAHLIVKCFDQVLAGQQSLHCGIGIVQHIGVAAVGVEGEGAIEAAYCTADGAAGGPEADAGDGELLPVAIGIRVVGEDVAAWIGAACLIDAFDGDGRIRDGGGGIIGPLDGDGDGGQAAGAGGIHQGVGKAVGQGIGRQTQGLHRRQVVVDHIGVAAIPIEQQPAIVAPQLGAQGTSSARAPCGAGADSGDMPGFIGVAGVGVAVVGEHVAGGIAAEGGVAESPGLDGGARVIHRHRGIITAVDGDHQGGDVVEVAQIRDPVAEGLGEGVPLPQGLDGGIAVVHQVAIAAVGPQGQGAVEPDNDGAIGAGAAAGNIGYLAEVGVRSQGDLADPLAVSRIDVGVVGEHIADGVRAGLADPLLGGAACIVAAQGGVVGALDGDDETGLVADALVIDHLIVELLGQGVTAKAQPLHIGVVVVEDVAIATPEQHIEGAVLAGNAGLDIDRIGGGTVAGGRAGHLAKVQDVAVGGDVHVGVIAQQIALGRGAGQVVGGTARFPRRGGVVLGDGGIVDRVEGDEDAGGGRQGILGIAGDAVAVELVTQLAVVVDQHREGVAAVVILVATVIEGQQGGIEGGQIAGQGQLATAVVGDYCQAGCAPQGEHALGHRQGEGESTAARVHVGHREPDQLEILIFIHALGRGRVAQGGRIVELHIADVGTGFELAGVDAGLGEH